MLRHKLYKRFSLGIATLGFAALLTCFTATAAGDAADEKPLIMGVFPRRNMTETITLFSPMAQHLAQQLGRPVRVESTRDFETFWRNVTQKRYDIVHCNQYLYVKAHKLLGYDAILKNEEFGRSTMRAAIVARTGRGIHSLRDLRGKTILFGGGRNAMQSYIIPTFMMRKAGLKAGDYTEKYALNPPNAVLALYAGQIDSIGVGDNTVRESSGDATDVIYLATSEAYAHLPWAVSPDMPKALRAKIQNILIGLRSLPEGQTILNRAKLTGVVSATDAEYDAQRQIIYQVLGERY